MKSALRSIDNGTDAWAWMYASDQCFFGGPYSFKLLRTTTMGLNIHGRPLLTGCLLWACFANLFFPGSYVPPYPFTLIIICTFSIRQVSREYKNRRPGGGSQLRICWIRTSRKIRWRDIPRIRLRLMLQIFGDVEEKSGDLDITGYRFFLRMWQSQLFNLYRYLQMRDG